MNAQTAIELRQYLSKSYVNQYHERGSINTSYSNNENNLFTARSNKSIRCAILTYQYVSPPIKPSLIAVKTASARPLTDNFL